MKQTVDGFEMQLLNPGWLMGLTDDGYDDDDDDGTMITVTTTTGTTRTATRRRRGGQRLATPTEGLKALELKGS